MKKMTIKSLQLCSFKEKKALKIVLDPKRNLILGSNDTGKSCLMKTIYYTLGASVKFEDTWLTAKVLSLLTFDLDGVEYSVLRDEKTFSVYDKDMTHIQTFTSVTAGIGKYLAELFDFQLKLLGRNEEATTPTPAFMFLPFYIDQDKGWGKSFDSFESLMQFKDYRTPTIEFHTGVRPNEYYKAKIEQKIANDEKALVQKDYDIVDTILNRCREKYKAVDFTFNFTNFKEEITELVEKANVIRDKQNAYRETYRDLYDDLHTSKHQLHAVESALKKSQQDFKYSTEFQEDTISCPTCHTEFENSFSERIEIARDTNQFDQMYIEIQSRTLQLENTLNEHKNLLQPLQESLAKTELLLGEKTKTLELQHLIQAEGRKEVIEELKDQRSEIMDKITAFNEKLEILDVKLKGFADKEKKKSVESTYVVATKRFLAALDVNNIAEAKFKKLTSVIEKSGSDKPRALLAYFYGIIETIHKHSTFMSCPLVIDSPNQQAQDDTNIQRILELIRDNSPKDSQVILAVEGLHEVPFKWNTIKLKSKLSLLQKKPFDDISLTFKKLINLRTVESDEIE